MNLDLELPSVIANSIDRLVHVIPYPLESGTLGPQINDILPHRVSHIRNVSAVINPSSCGVRSYGRVLKVKSIGTLRITKVQSADVPNGLTRIVGTGIISIHELVTVLGE